MKERLVFRYASVAVAAMTWGTWPLILRGLPRVARMDPALQSTVVMTLATLVAAFLSRHDRVRRRATWSEWAGVGWLGIGDAGNYVLFFAAYAHTSVAVAVLTHYLTPILVAMAAPFVLRERADLRSVIAVALSFAGLVLLLSPWSAGRRADDWIGAACGAGSAVFYASNVLVNKRLVHAFSTSELSFFHGVVAAPLLALLVPAAAWHSVEPGAVFALAGGALGPGVFAGLAFVWGLRRIRASHASTLTLLEPLVAVLIGVVALGEPLTAGAVVGGLLILGGAGLVMTRRSG